MQLLLCTFIFPLILANKNDNEPQCVFNKKLNKELQKYEPIAKTIVESLVNGVNKGTTYNHLAYFVDKFGHRFTGTQNLENSIDYMLKKSRECGLENVRFENVTVPHWVRGEESATLIHPRKLNLRMLGLGYSIGTPPEGIQAEAIVVKDFDELIQKKNMVKGKIVVYDQKFVSYHVSRPYRAKGASEASKLGAVAALINSVTPFSLNTPHTGEQNYYPEVIKIPVACITPQDAHKLRRMQNWGEKLTINLKMNARNLKSKISRNSIMEIKGTEYPEKVVLISGHLDSWDVGEGAMDDGGGMFITWNALVVLKKLGLRPKRTIRAVLWTAEEMGLIGAEQYVKRHQHEIENFNFVMESDLGTFWPLGLAVSGTDECFCIVKEVLNLLKPFNMSIIKKGAFGPDIDYFLALGVPGAGLLNKNEDYFVYHHSEADTMDVEDPKALDYATALWATVSFVIADMISDLPKKLNSTD